MCRYIWSRADEKDIPDRGNRIYKDLRQEKICYASGTASNLVELKPRIGEYSSLMLFKILLLKWDCKASKRRNKEKQEYKKQVRQQIHIPPSSLLPFLRQCLTHISLSNWKLWEGNKTPYFKVNSSRIPSWRGKSSTKRQKWKPWGKRH